MRSLRMKLILIMVLLILALMTVVGTFLINGVGNFYIHEFYVQMENTFTQDFILQLQATANLGEDGPERLRELLMSQSNLGIDITNRNVYVLDQEANVLDSSNQKDTVGITSNLLSAMNGVVGQDSSINAAYMDLAIPISSEKGNYIVYILDNKYTVNALIANVLSIIFRSLALGLAICVVLSILLAQILITPIRALTAGTRQVAAGDFSQKLEVTSRDEIGTLTRNFNNMAQVLQNTLSQVENERNKLSTLFLHMTDGVVAFGVTGFVIHYNPAATRMLSRALDPTMHFSEIFGQEGNFEELLAMDRSQYVEARKTASGCQLDLFMAPFSSEHTYGGVLVVMHDVTEQEKNEQTRREFVANVSHELRTPLTNIKSYAETIASSGEELPPQLRANFMEVIINETDRMTRIVQDLLTLSKFDSGKLEMNLTRFPFATAVEHVCAAVSLDAQNHGHHLTRQLPPSLPEIEADRERIEQVIMNIVSNAIKYTPDGGEISITAGTGKGTVWLQVADNGIGIPEKDLPRLFERFYRVDKARSRESGGTGLGLSIAKEILNQHGGDIVITSQYKEGTTVTITLPAAL